MTRKDYQLIASVIKANPGLDNGQKASLAADFAVLLKQDNERFDVQRFVSACVELQKVS